DGDRTGLAATEHVEQRGPGAGFRAGCQLHAASAASNSEGLMTARIGSAVAAKVMGRITADRELASLFSVGHVRSQNVPADMAERGSVKYPAVNVYCEQIVNQLTEKFRTFSGTVHMAVGV